MSVPGPGQQAQAYETSDDLYAQQPWNTLPIRATTPATITEGQLEVQGPVSLQGATLAINPGDRMVFYDHQVKAGSTRQAMSVLAVNADASAGVTTVILLPDPPKAGSSTGTSLTPHASAQGNGPLPGLGQLITPLEIPPSVPPPDSAHLSGPAQTAPRSCPPALPRAWDPRCTRPGRPRPYRPTRRWTVPSSSASRPGCSARRPRSSRSPTPPAWRSVPGNGR